MEPFDQRFSRLDHPDRIGYLIGCFITGTLSLEERDELDAWVVADPANMKLFEDMTDDHMVNEYLRWLATRNTEGKLIDAKKRLRFHRRPMIRWWYYAAAAGIAGVIGLVVFFRLFSPGSTPALTDNIPADIPPGSPAAELRLPDGKVIRLDEVSDTAIGVIQIKNGAVVYGESMEDTGWHEIHIPRKGRYQLVLPDGSHVWLNAQSSIRYPGRFTGDKREVAVNGETYFEVKRDAARPFIVRLDTIRIEALGTAFNINGFDQAVTLTEGKIRVRGAAQNKVLQPGQQLAIGGWTTRQVETVTVLAWTRNQFRFKNASIQEVLRPVERWYDAKIVYADTISDHFNGTIDRQVPVSQVLQLLEATGKVHFSIEGNIITVKR